MLMRCFSGCMMVDLTRRSRFISPLLTIWTHVLLELSKQTGKRDLCRMLSAAEASENIV